MDDKLLLNAIEQMLDKKLEPIHEKIDMLTESVNEIRVGTNTLLEWADTAGDVIKVPFLKTGN